MISILHPSRQRPDLSLQTIKKWIARADTDLEIIISIDHDDESRSRYVDNLFELTSVVPLIQIIDDTVNLNEAIATNWDGSGHILKVIINKNRNAIDAINQAAKEATKDIFIVVSDDTDCPEHWDTLILQEVQGKTDWIMKTQDGIQPWLITMTLMDRAYYNRFGYIYYPGYDHLWADTELTAVADLTGRVIHSNLLFPHLHPAVNKAPSDALYERNNKTWNQGNDLFYKRAKKNFDLKEIAGTIQDAGVRRRIRRG